MKAFSFSVALLTGILVAHACSECRASEPYGFDIVPNSVFHHGTWSFYGSDPVPTSTTHTTGLPMGYGWDVVPTAQHPHIDDYRRVLPIETVQQLTGALRNEPAPRRVTKH